MQLYLSYRRQVDKANAIAQYNFGHMYSRSDGITQDYVMAHMYWNVALANGYKEAK